MENAVQIARGGARISMLLSLRPLRLTARGADTAVERGASCNRIRRVCVGHIDNWQKLEAGHVGKDPHASACRCVVDLWRGYMEFYNRRCDKLHGETIPIWAAITPSNTLREPHALRPT